jgi:hypothetical protein
LEDCLENMIEAVTKPQEALANILNGLSLSKSCLFFLKL